MKVKNLFETEDNVFTQENIPNKHDFKYIIVDTKNKNGLWTVFDQNKKEVYKNTKNECKKWIKDNSWR
jgi:hypothetical protein